MFRGTARVVKAGARRVIWTKIISAKKAHERDEKNDRDSQAQNNK